MINECFYPVDKENEEVIIMSTVLYGIDEK